MNVKIIICIIAITLWASIRLVSAAVPTETTAKSKIQLIRNATMKFTYAGKVFLTDPMLSQKGEIRSFAGIERNPTVELPIAIEDIIAGVDATIVSHLHPDHFHKAEKQSFLLSKPLFCQPEDEKAIELVGFNSVKPISNSIVWEGIKIIRVGGQHGEGEILSKMGKVSGFVFQATGEPTVYWAGDTIWCEEVAKTLEQFEPDIIITHSGGATIPGFKPILMDAEQTIKILKEASEATVIAIHMEALDHCKTTKKILQAKAQSAGISKPRLIIPENGETIPIK